MTPKMAENDACKSIIILVLTLILGAKAVDKVFISNCHTRDQAFDNEIETDESFKLEPSWVGLDATAIYEYDFEYKIYKSEDPDDEDADMTESDLDFDSIANGGMEIPPNTATPGLYEIDVTATKKATSFRHHLPKNPFDSDVSCYVNYVALDPIAIIAGGSTRDVSSKAEILVDGTKSSDPNRDEDSPKTLKFAWVCTQKLSPPTFCKRGWSSKAQKFTVPSGLVVEGDEFNFTLTVTTEFDTENSTSQIIKVKVGAATLQIVCKKNCPPLVFESNPKSITYVEVSCEASCDGISDNDYLWTIKKPSDPKFSFDYKKNSRFGRTGRKFIIEEDTLKPDQYTILVQLRPGHKRQGSALLEVNYGGGGDVTSCDITPKKGESLKTMFNFSCVQIPANDRNYYEFLVVNPEDFSNKVIVEGYYPGIFKQTFTLVSSKNRLFSIRVSKKGRPDIDLEVEVEVTSSFENKPVDEVISNINELYHGKTPDQSVANLAKSNDPDKRKKGMQILQTLVDEIVSTDNEDPKFDAFIKQLKFQATKDTINSPVGTVTETLGLSETLTTLYSYKKPEKSDPDLALLTTNVCNKMGTKMMKMMKKEKFPLDKADIAVKFSRVVSSCTESELDPNYEIMGPVQLNITTPAPMDEQLITENYPNYNDYDDKYYKNLDSLKKTTDNILSTSANTAKVVAMTTASGEGVINVRGKIDSLVVLKDVGYEISNATLSSHGVVLIPSKDWENDYHDYDVLLVTWKKDIFWWNPAHTRVISDIARIQFWHSTCKKRVREFGSPIELFFKIKRRFNFSVNNLEDVFDVPENYGTKTDSELDRMVKVYRFAVAKSRKLHIKFLKVSLRGGLKITTLKFKYPTFRDFLENSISILVNTTSEMVNTENYDILVYVGILAKKVVKGPLRINYEMEYYVSNCITWRQPETKWEPSCMPGDEGNASTIHCKCHHSSVFAGYTQKIDATPLNVTEVELELKLAANYVIFLTLLVTYGIFDILLILFLLQKKKQIYFLADNNAQHLFAYLITVKTGMGYSSGTTSNIVIMLVGEKRSSNPHVLNYPDPKMCLLQSFGEDMFILTTAGHLGNLKQIELWFDSIGTNPTWFCRDIYVYDMQLRIEWYFKVKKKLSVTKDNTHIIEKRLSQRYHTWYLFHQEEHISYVKKLTIMLSTVLTTYVLALFFYGLPLFQLRDILERHNKYYVNTYTIFVAFVSSFPAFMFHIVVAWWFRVSRSQFSRYKETGKLPFHTTVACWTALICLISITTSFLVIFGFWVPYYSSLAWLTACVIGIVFGVFIYESVFVLFQNFCCKFELIRNIDRMFKDILEALEVQRKYLFAQFGTFILRPYFQHLYTPLRKKQITILKRRLLQRKYVIAETEDLVMFGIYIMILYVVVLANKDSFMVRGKTDMEEVMQGLHSRSMEFEEIHSVQDIYLYLNTTLMPCLHPMKWYHTFVVSLPALMIDMVNKYMGVVRIRQQRMTPDVCEAAGKMNFLNLSCWPEFSLSSGETKTFGKSWKEYVSAMEFDRLKAIWQYRTEAETETHAHFGQFATYSGGGYVLYMGRTFYNSFANWLRVYNDYWIDGKSRAIFIEFLAYNANYNMFNSVRLIFEQSATGYIIRDVYVQSVRMLFVENEVEKMASVFFILFVVWVAILFLKYSLGTIKNIRSFYKDVWLLIDLVIIGLSITCICVFLIRVYMVGKYLDRLEKVKHNEFVSYFHLLYIEDFLSFVAAFLVCIATIRLWKFLRFAFMFRVLERTLSLAGIALLSFAVAFFIVLICFSMTVYLILANYFKRIYNLPHMARLMMTMALRPLEMGAREFFAYKAAVFYMSLYMILLQLNTFIFIMIIVKSYIEAQLELSNEVTEYNIRNYVEERVQYIPRYIWYKSKRMKGGMMEFDRPKVQHKSDKFLYSHCKLVATPRMNKMIILTKCFIRNQVMYKKPQLLRDDDIKLMSQVCKAFLLKTDEEHDVEIFYKGRVLGRRLKFIDERNLDKIANIVNWLLQEELPEFGSSRPDAQLEECFRAIEQRQKTLQKLNLDLKLALLKLNTFERQLMKVLH